MLSLGVKITPDEIKIIIDYYNSKSGHPGSKEISYEHLLQDVQDGEPSITEFVPDMDSRDVLKERYTFENEKYAVQPPLIRQFIQAIRLSVMKRILREGGTPFSIVRQIFMHYDLNYSSALCASELIPAMRKGMGLVFTDAHAAEVLKFYNRDSGGEMGYQILLRDIVNDFPSMLDFTASSASYINKNSKNNPFVKKEFELKDNKTVESFRARLLTSLNKQIASRGGTVKSLIRDAFTFWDSRCCGKLKSVTEIRGALRRLHISASDNEVHLLIARYDTENDGQMNYNLFIDDMTKDERSFLSDTGTSYDASVSPTARSPANVTHSVNLFKSKADMYSSKTGGQLVPRDILHGTFLRHDPARKGSIGLEALKSICREIHVQLSDAKLQVLLSWFDSDGSNTLDYNMFIDQLYGPSKTFSDSVSAKKMETDDHSHMRESIFSYSSPLRLPPVRKKKPKVGEESKIRRMALVNAEKAFIKSKLSSIDSQMKILENRKRMES